jgi:hypothetical protein
VSKKIPRGDENLICRWHKQPMSEVCHKCDAWTHLQGRSPNTGETIDDWKCADSWIPILLLEIAQQARSGAAATESFRNEMTARADASRGEQLALSAPALAIAAISHRKV